MKFKNNAGRGGLIKSLQLASAVSFIGISQLTSAVVIDDFTIPQAEVVDQTLANGPEHGWINGSEQNIVGGSRDLLTEMLGGFLSLKMFVLDSEGAVSFSVNSVTQGSGTVQWDGPDNSPLLDHNGLGGVDLTENGTINAFELTTSFADHGHKFKLEIYTDTTHWTAVTFSRNSSIGGGVNAPISEVYDFSNFTNPILCSAPIAFDAEIINIECGDGPADLSNVGAIQLIIDPFGEISELDVVIDKLQTLSTCFGSIGDYVWNDANRDGIQDADEMGIDGVEIDIAGASGSSRSVTTFTGGPLVKPGYYLVEGLCADTYTVSVDPVTVPAGLEPTLVGSGSGGELDSNEHTGTNVELTTDDSHDHSIDFGYQTPCSGAIGDYIWNDSNRDGIQDAGEMGVNGVEVIISDSQNNQHSVTTFTGGPLSQPGYYLVDGLCADTYNVSVSPNTVPSGKQKTLLEVPGDNTVDSNDPDGTDVTLSDDHTVDVTIDFGYQTPCSGAIGDYVWNDLNRNGIQEANETGINGVQIVITDNDGNNHMVTTFTGGPLNQAGYYLVNGLCANTYTVAVDPVTVPDGLEATLIEVPGDSSIDSNNPAGTEVILSDDHSEDITIDFGFQTPCSGAIGDYIWNDLDRDGIQDPGENGINGVEVIVTDSSGHAHSVTTFTGGPLTQPGYYRVDGLCADTYNVAVNPDTVPPGKVTTVLGGSSDPALDSDNPEGTTVVLTDDDIEDVTIDFGYQTPCSGAIGDYVWNDLNRNGIQEDGEIGINGIEVLVTDSQGMVHSVTTFTGGPLNQPGYYRIDGLCADTYNVAVNPATVPPQFDKTLIGEGGDGTKDSNNPDGVTVALTEDDSEDTSIDFGYQTPCSGSIGDYVWNDVNRNGIQEDGETGIDGVEVLITDANGVVHTVTTFTGGPENKSGYYLIDGLCAGTYRVEIDSSTVPSGFEVTPIGEGADPLIDSNDPSGTQVVLNDDHSQDLSIDFGYNVPQLLCQLSVDQTCSVVPELVSDDDLLCQAKIAATTFRYIGPNRVATVKFVGKNGGLAEYQNVNLVSGVTVLSTQNGFTIDAGSGSDLGSKLSVYINGVLEEIIHTSCSAVYYAGRPAPLDGNTPYPENSEKADPSPNWFVLNFRDKLGGYVSGEVSSDPEPGQQSCVVPQGGANVDYFYSITNYGDTAINLLSLFDDHQGELLSGAIPLLPGASTSFSTTVFVNESVTSNSSVQAEVAADASSVCVDMDEVVITVAEPDPDEECMDDDVSDSGDYSDSGAWGVGSDSGDWGMDSDSGDFDPCGDLDDSDSGYVESDSGDFDSDSGAYVQEDDNKEEKNKKNKK